MNPDFIVALATCAVMQEPYTLLSSCYVIKLKPKHSVNHGLGVTI